MQEVTGEMNRRSFMNRHCPRCGGNLYLDTDHYGWYEQCLQCGCIRDLPVVRAGASEETVANVTTAREAVSASGARTLRR